MPAIWTILPAEVIHAHRDFQNISSFIETLHNSFDLNVYQDVLLYKAVFILRIYSFIFRWSI
jgi:hypothetical protein